MLENPNSETESKDSLSELNATSQVAKSTLWLENILQEVKEG